MVLLEWVTYVNELIIVHTFFCPAFESVVGTVVALRKNKQFVDSVDNGDECGVLLEQTNFYAESGGQIWDEGFMEKEDNSVSDFSCV